MTPQKKEETQQKEEPKKAEEKSSPQKSSPEKSSPEKAKSQSMNKTKILDKTTVEKASELATHQATQGVLKAIPKTAAGMEKDLK